MKQNYHDIIEAIDRKPQWFDENGVPRYCDFHPSEVANIYAQEAVLLLIRCQACGTQFHAAMSLDHMDYHRRGRKGFADDIEARELHYGDPPNIDCCVGGATMNSEPWQVLEYWWRKFPVGWTREARFEVDITPDWAKPEPPVLLIEGPK